MNHINDECGHCHKASAGLYENPKKAGQFLCFDCLDKAAPWYVNLYPGWREHERARQQKAELARKNFNPQRTQIAQSNLFSKGEPSATSA